MERGKKSVNGKREHECTSKGARLKRGEKEATEKRRMEGKAECKRERLRVEGGKASVNGSEYGGAPKGVKT